MAVQEPLTIEAMIQQTLASQSRGNHQGLTRDHPEPESHGTVPFPNTASRDTISTDSPTSTSANESAVTNGTQHNISVQRPAMQLQDHLAADDNLRDWLKMTKWDDVEYRLTTLSNWRLEREEAELEEQLMRIRLKRQATISQGRGTLSTSAATSPSMGAMPPGGLPQEARPQVTELAKGHQKAEISAGKRPAEVNVGAENGGNKKPKLDETSGTSSTTGREADHTRAQRTILDIKVEPSSNTSINNSTTELRLGRHDVRQADNTSAAKYQHYFPREDRDRPNGPALVTADTHRPSARVRSGDRGHTNRDGRPPPIGLRRRDVHSEIGRNGENAAFYVVEGQDFRQIYDSVYEGVWAVSPAFTNTLHNVFLNNVLVVLFFSVVDSDAYEGYAVMRSAPAPDVPRPSWARQSDRALGQAFRIEWIARCSFRRSHANWVKNDREGGAAVSGSRHGQEIQPKAGEILLGLMDKRNFAESRERRD